MKCSFLNSYLYIFYYHLKPQFQILKNEKCLDEKLVNFLFSYYNNNRKKL